MPQADTPLARVHALLDQLQAEQAMDTPTTVAPATSSVRSLPKPSYLLPL